MDQNAGDCYLLFNHDVKTSLIMVVLTTISGLVTQGLFVYLCSLEKVMMVNKQHPRPSEVSEMNDTLPWDLFNSFKPLLGFI